MEEVLNRIEKRLGKMENNQDTLFDKVDNMQKLLNETSRHIMVTNEFIREMAKQVSENTICINRIESDVDRNSKHINGILIKNPDFEGNEDIFFEDNKPNNGG